jgi:hypothetical protein
MLDAAWTRIAAIILLTVSAASCGGGGGGGDGAVGSGGGNSGGGVITPPSPPTQSIAAMQANASNPTGAPSTSTASLWLGNATELGVSAYVSQSAPTSNFGAWVITNVTVPTTYYLRGSYTNNGIASIQASAADPQFRVPQHYHCRRKRSNPDSAGIIVCAQRRDQLERHRSGQQPSVEFNAARDRASSRYCDRWIGVD